MSEYADRVGGNIAAPFSRRAGRRGGTARRGAARWRWGEAALVALCWSPVAAMLWTERPWLVDIVTQFAVPIVPLLLLATVVVARPGRRVAAVLTGAAFGTMLALTIAAYRAGPSASAALAGPVERVRVAIYNAAGPDSAGDLSFAAWLMREGPDLVAVIDPAPGFPGNDASVLAAYPHRILPIDGLNWPIVLLSKHPFTDAELAPFDEAVKFSFVARRSILVSLPGGAKAVFTAMYPRSPRNLEFWRTSLQSVRTDAGVIRRWRQSQGADAPGLILVGDFNSTPTGRTHRLMRSISGMRPLNALVGGGTWPAWMPPAVSLPIDRVWVSERARAVSWRVGPQMASDHRAVLADIEVVR